jgi:hypothetical protein
VLLFLFSLDAAQPGNVLTFLVNVTLGFAIVGIEKCLPTAPIQFDEQMSAIVPDVDRDFFSFQQFQILLGLGHGFRRMMMMIVVSASASTHDGYVFVTAGGGAWKLEVLGFLDYCLVFVGVVTLLTSALHFLESISSIALRRKKCRLILNECSKLRGLKTKWILT